jgi:hypothetical protein
VSVWLQSVGAEPELSGSEGALVSVSITVDPRDLESLLEALAGVDFPVNPAIYHEAAVVYVYSGDRQETVPTTLVEFPAYEGNVRAVRDAIAAVGLDPQTVQVTGMLESIRAECVKEPGPGKGGWLFRYRLKSRAAARANG